VEKPAVSEKKIKVLPDRFHYLMVIGWVILCRLPMLYSPYRVLDGDECIVGLMGKHLLEGSDFTCFFYGQPYGFALPESLLCGLGQMLFGAGTLAVRWPMTLLFAFCCCLLYRWMKKSMQPGQALAGTLLFAVFPAWMAFSVKARGGYLCGLFFTLLCLNILSEKNTAKWQRIFLASFFAALAALSHQLYVPGICCVAFAVLFEEKKSFREIGVFGVSSACIYFMLQFLLPAMNPDAYGTPAHFWLAKGWLFALPEKLFLFFTGWWGNREYLAMTQIQEVASWMILSVMVLLAVFAWYDWIKNKRFLFGLSGGVLLAGILSFFPVLTGTVEDFSFRYLLPGSFFLFLYAWLLFSKTVGETRKRASLLVALLFFVFVQNAVYMSYYYEPYPENSLNACVTEEKLLAFIDELKKEEQQVFVCTDGLLQWQLLYYSNETLLASYKANEGRYTRYTDAVKSSLSLTGKGYLLGFRQDLIGPDGLPESPKKQEFQQLFFTAGPYSAKDIFSSVYLK